MPDYYDVTPLSEPDPGWVCVDPAGHTHYWVFDGNGRESLPTLTAITDHEGDDYGPGRFHHECSICGAVVRPGWRAPLYRKYMRL